jgi:HD-GYP domain-containing protein (c-di-GMP phosphodiesterase class II)
MGQMKPALRWYLFGVILAGLVAVAGALIVQPPALSQHLIVLATLLTSLSALTYLAPVKHAPKRQFLFYTSLQTVAILTLAPGVAAVPCALGVALGNLYLRRQWFNAAFNTAQIALTVVVAGAVYRWLAPVSLADPDRDLRSVLALIPAGVLLYVVTAVAVECATSIQRRTLPFGNFLTVRGPTLLPHVALVVVGAATAPAVADRPWLILVAVAPVMLLRSALRASLDFDEETVSVVEAVANAVDQQHPALRGRSQEIADLATRLAALHGQPEETCRRVALAARMHDVAAAFLPASVMLDGDGADAEGRVYTQNHAEVGAAYVMRVLRLPGVAEAIRYHHERYDGGGRYAVPGKNIPLESRIIGVAEAWVTLTRRSSDLPEMSPEQALVMLRAGAGTQWDPVIVALLPDALRGTAWAPQAVPLAAPVPGLASSAG